MESVLTQLKMDLEYKTQRLLECEAQLAEVSKVKEELLVTLDREKREHTDQLIESQRLLAEKETELAEVKAESVAYLMSASKLLPPRSL